MLGLRDGGALGKLSTGYASLEAVFDTDLVVRSLAHTSFLFHCPLFSDPPSTPCLPSKLRAVILSNLNRF